MTRRTRYSDEELVAAVQAAGSWRDVLRRLGAATTSGGSIKAVRDRADSLELDYSHFRGRTRWREEDLESAIVNATTWEGAVSALRMTDVPSVASLKGHAARLGVNVGHLASDQIEPVAEMLPDLGRLNRAGPMLAAAWFTLCGLDVAWPLEPCRYDLVVTSRTGARRVQVKTTTTRVDGSWKVFLSTTSGARHPYSPDEIDDFFVIDGDLKYYLIPIEVVGGRHALHLTAYERFGVATRS
ncbi:hypothetical protein M2317_003295 [Microbacterium sp. ZKA21]|uniref:group I intron-associated PD-(D/E)XK endonuclease n=1 Tax=Microbacterium sp. ZKA21 TaxID=3381694 RepID=UPI003D23114D